jgi:hydroxymethylbilane synthase
MWQTNWVVERLKELHPDYRFRIVAMKTQGDKILDVALAKIGDKGLFTKELEIALLNGEADMAVHSMKDLPTMLPAGLLIGCICQRVDPRDVLISRDGRLLAEMPAGARIGTSSLRRCAQLLHYRPDLRLEPLRGNLNTRLAKLLSNNLDGIILAAAGVERMGWGDRISERLPISICLPAVGQGSIGIEIREDDQEIHHLVQSIHHQSSGAAIIAERALLRKLEGGCQVPIGALGTVTEGVLTVQGVVAGLDGRDLVRDQLSGPVAEAALLGERLAQRLLDQGAGRILQNVRGCLAGADQPLLGKRVLVTRSRSQAGVLSEKIKALGGETWECPVIEIVPPADCTPLDKAITDLEAYDWLVFTSVNGVKFFMARMDSRQKGRGSLAKLRIVAIGPRTREEIEGYGLFCEFTPQEYVAEAVIEQLGRRQIKGQKILLPRADIARRVLPEALRAMGAEVDEVTAYQTVTAAGDAQELRKMLQEKRLQVLTFTSSSTVRNFVQMIGAANIPALTAGTVVACIGPVTADTAGELGLPVTVQAADYTVDGLVKAILDYYRGVS